jgi:hypothetical protein
MRQGRNRALKEFRLADEIPFCREEGDIEEITSALDNIQKRRVDQGMLQAKRRRLASKPVIENKEIDDVIVKSLVRLCTAVEDVFSYEHQADIVSRRACAQKVGRAARDSKAKQLFHRKILEETQQRTHLRQQKMELDIEAKMKEAAAAAIASRREEVRSSKRERDRELLGIAEQEFARKIRLDKEAAERENKNRRIARRADIDVKRKQHLEDVDRSLKTLRRGMDHLDSAADAMINRRFVVRC